MFRKVLSKLYEHYLENIGSTSTPKTPTLMQLIGTPAQGDQKPKKPLTPYFRFMAKLRPEVQKTNPNLKAVEVAKIVGEKWAKLDLTTKQSYSDAFKSEMTSYSKILEKYNQSLTPEVREAVQQQKVDKQVRKEKREHRKRVRDLGKPKKPPTPFLQYLMTKIKPGTGIEGYRSAAKEEGSRWKSLSESEKQPWIAKYKVDSDKYKKELLKWEGLMLKQGHDDLVRVKQLSQATSTSHKSK